MKFYIPTIEEIRKAHKIFENKEPRDLFYRAAIELVDLAIQGKTTLSLAEALAVLLQTWNKAYYRYKVFDTRHFADIEHLLDSHSSELLSFRKRSIENYCEEDKMKIKKIFEDFEKVLGPVGTSKCLHLLAPYFFPLWDRAIARAYHINLKKIGGNAEKYCHFMAIVREQCRRIGGEKTIGRNPLKAIDEYNYCKYTKNWI